jgi:hypothetical protein
MPKRQTGSQPELPELFLSAEDMALREHCVQGLLAGNQVGTSTQQHKRRCLVFRPAHVKRPRHYTSAEN